MRGDLALVNGRVVDPDLNEIYDADIVLKDGHIVAISRERGQAADTPILDMERAFVTPALIDAHVHCFEHVSPGSLNPDRIGVRQGVGAIIDAGSFGPRNAAGFREFIVQQSKTRVYGLVNISRWGNSTNPGESEIIGFLNPTDVVRTIDQAHGWLRGVKVRASVTAVGALGILPVHLAKQAAREAGVPLMVHIGNGPPTLEEVCALLTEGDVITHCFHGKIGGAITRHGKLLPAVADAVARGVLLDVGHGSGSFAWSTAEQALQLGQPPHSISTDLHAGCVSGVPGKRSRVTLLRVMSKMLRLGMSLMDVVRATTIVPAHTFGLEPLFGHLTIGAPANVSVFAQCEHDEVTYDVEGQSRHMTQTLEPRYTILDGHVYEAEKTE